MDAVAAFALAAAVLSLGLALTPGAVTSSLRSFIGRRLHRERQRLAAARVSASPAAYLGISLLAPGLLFGIGWVESPVLAIAGAARGIMVPRLYLNWLVHAQTP